MLGGYLLGSMPFGYWVPKLVRGEDIRTKGSGNVGASNVFRVYGRSLGIPVALLDLAKGFAAAALGLWVGGALIGVLAASAAMVGHARPIFLRFEKGGKMVGPRAEQPLRSRRSPRSSALRSGSSCSWRPATRHSPRSSPRSRSRSSSSSSTIRGRSSRSGLRERQRSSFSTARTSAASSAAASTASSGSGLAAEPGGERRLVRTGLARRELSVELADGPVALGHHVVHVDRLEVDLP